MANSLHMRTSVTSSIATRLSCICASTRTVFALIPKDPFLVFYIQQPPV